MKGKGTGQESPNITELASKTAENQTFAEGFNQGMHLAAQKFETLIILLCFVYFVRILIHPEAVDEKLPYVSRDTLKFSLDVLGFTLTLILLYSLLGVPLASQF